jgi:uncharacterized protein Yka (UPF0111/DUF47 family)
MAVQTTKTGGQNRRKRGISRVLHAFLPKQPEMFALFAQVGEMTLRGAQALRELVNHPDSADSKRDEIKILEHEADQKMHEILERLYSTFVTPVMFGRSDIVSMSVELDDILDFIHAAADRIYLYRDYTGSVPEATVKLADILVEAARELRALLCQLEKVEEVSKGYCERVNELENAGDDTLRMGTLVLLNEARDIPSLVRMVIWLDINERIETAIDRCEDTVNVIEGVVMKNV